MMKEHLAFLGLLLALLMGQSSSRIHSNQDCVHLVNYGSCKGYEMMWAYSMYDRKCITFAYSTCGGNKNRFSTQKECEMACM